MPGKRSGQRFDAAHGVATEALLFLGELDPDAIGDALGDATHYEATPVLQFEALMSAVPVSVRGWTFLDVGAGMGRVVMLASQHPFKQVIGVEVSPALCEVARDNVVRWRRSHAVIACKDLRIVCRDATSFALPPGDVVVYLYNPFGAASVERLADRVAYGAAHAFVLYHTPVHRHVFDSHAALELVCDAGFGVVYEAKRPKGGASGTSEAPSLA